MSIDWITVTAQIANFLVLVWLLKRFLYQPILDGIEAREVEITNRMQEAGRAKEKAEATEADYSNKVHALDVAQSEMSETIRKTAEEKRDTLLADARQRLEQERLSWQAHLDADARKYATKLHTAGAGALLSLTRKALIDLSDETLEERITHQLIKQIKPMAADLTRAAGDAIIVKVTSHEPLSQAAKDNLTVELNAAFPDISVKFDANAEQAPGLVLRMGGAQVAWTVDSYIEELKTLIGTQLANTGTQEMNSHVQ